MKKTFTLICLVAIAKFGFSQSLQFWDNTNAIDVTDDTVLIPVQANQGFVNELALKNTTSDTINYQMNRTILNPPLPAGCDVYFCSGTQCYNAYTSTFWDPSIANPNDTGGFIGANASLPSGQGTYGLSAHFDLSSICSDVYVLYKVYNRWVASDSSRVTLHYSCTTGINDHTSSFGFVSDAFPNPSSNLIYIKYELNVIPEKIIFSDVLGKVVKENIINDKQGTAKINISDLNDGLYFYSFVSENKVIVTKKLIVSNK